jgi:hypothetical protein
VKKVVLEREIPRFFLRVRFGRFVTHLISLLLPSILWILLVSLFAQYVRFHSTLIQRKWLHKLTDVKLNDASSFVFDVKIIPLSMSVGIGIYPHMQVVLIVSNFVNTAQVSTLKLTGKAEIADVHFLVRLLREISIFEMCH